jgi:hypothetical protein
MNTEPSTTSPAWLDGHKAGSLGEPVDEARQDDLAYIDGHLTGCSEREGDDPSNPYVHPENFEVDGVTKMRRMKPEVEHELYGLHDPAPQYGTFVRFHNASHGRFHFGFVTGVPYVAVTDSHGQYTLRNTNVLHPRALLPITYAFKGRVRYINKPVGDFTFVDEEALNISSDDRADLAIARKALGRLDPVKKLRSKGLTF